MAKPATPAQDRYLIKCEIESSQLGRVVGALTRMGVTNPVFELITPARADKQVPKLEMSGKDLLAEFVRANPSFKAIDAVRAFEESGRTGGSVYPEITKAVREKRLISHGGGHYSVVVRAAGKSRMPVRESKHIGSSFKRSLNGAASKGR